MKFLKRFLKTTFWIVLILAVLFVSLFYGIQTPQGQNLVVPYVTKFLSSQLQTKVTIGRINFKFFTRVKFVDLYIEDRHQDTLLFAKSLIANIGLFSYEKQKITITDIRLSNSRFKLKKYPGEPGSSLDFVIDFLSGNDTTPSTNKGWDFKLESGIVRNTVFSLTNLKHVDTIPTHELNFNDLYITNLNANLYDFVFKKDSTYFFAKDLSFKDKCGLDVKHFTANASIDDTFMRFDNLHLITKESNLKGYFGMDYSNWDSFDDFNDSIKLRVQLKDSSHLSSNDVKYFAEELEGLNRSIKITGLIRGTVSRLKGKNLDIQYGNDTRFAGNININGFPDIEQTYFDLMIDELSSSKKDIESIPLYPFGKNGNVILPENLSLLKRTSFKGKFTGFYNDFVAYGDATTALGNLTADVNIKFNEKTESYSGHLTANSFDIGQMWKVSDVVHKVSFDASIEGDGFSLANAKVVVKGIVKQADVYGYNYSNVIVNGAIAKKQFDGSVKIDEPNVYFDFAGNIDFTKPLPMYDFNATFDHVKIATLGLINRDKITAISGNCQIIMSGNNPDNLRGSFNMTNFKYSESEKSFTIPELDFTADDNANNGRNFMLKSSLADASIIGASQVTTAIDAARNYLSSYIPLIPKPAAPVENQKFDFEMQLHQTDSFFNIFVPDLRIASESIAQGHVDNFNKTFNLLLQTPKFDYQSLSFRELSLKSSSDSDLLNLDINTKGLVINDSIQAEAFHIIGKSMHDSATVQISAGNKNDSLDTKVNIGLDFIFGGNNDTRLSIIPESEIKIKQSIWKFEANNSLLIESEKLRIQNLKFFHDKDEYIAINGIVSDNKNEKLNIVFDRFDLIYLQDIFSLIDLNLGGICNGDIDVAAVTGNKLMNGNLLINNLSFFGDTLGDATIKSEFKDEEKIFNIDGFIEKDGSKRVSVKGDYHIGLKENYLDFNIDLNRADLTTFQHYLDGLIHDLHGTISAKLTLKGRPDNPKIDGTANLQKANFIIDYLNTRYSFTNEVKIDENYVYLNKIVLNDLKGNQAIVNGKLYHNHFKNLDYDFEIKTSNFQVLNIKEGQNEMFYGTAFASGVVDINGNPDYTNMLIKLKSEKGTDISIPLSSPEEVGENGFITFEKHDTLKAEEQPEKKSTSSAINLELEMQVTQDATIQLIFDQKIGDVIKGTGNGIISMKVLPDGTFGMYGDYVIQEGDYLFTMSNVLGKYFRLQKGGSIKWTGDPYGAKIDLSASYTKNVGLYDLLQDTSAAMKKKVETDVLLHLKNNLFNPDISFDIKVQNIDASTQTRIDRYLNNEEEKLRQAMSIIIFNRFSKPQDYTGEDIFSNSNSAGAGVSASLSEFISKQLSSWASQINRNFNVDFNYTPGDALTQQQYDIALSTKLLNERLKIYTSFGFGPEEQSKSTNYLVGDFIVEYNLTTDGRIKIRAFNKSNLNTLTSSYNAPYTQGFGWFYRKEFTSGKSVFKSENKTKKRKKDSTAASDSIPLKP